VAAPGAKIPVMNKLIATFFYIGLVSKAPGTFGSLAAIPLILTLMYFQNFWALLAVTVVLYFIGWFATRAVMRESGLNDPQFVVIDEVVGMLVAFITLLSIPLALMASLSVKAYDFGQWRWWLAILLLLVLFVWFRFFDIKKPWPASYFDQQVKNAHGVMLDDVVAGIIAGLATLATIFVVTFVFVLIYGI